MWGAWHKTSSQQIQECGGVLSTERKEKGNVCRKEGQ